MFLVKNRLKKVKRDNEDDMLHYLKYSHLDNIPEDDYIPDFKEYKDKATQFPNIKNKSTQTYNKEMEDKATDTMDDLHKIDYKYRLVGDNRKHRSNEKLRGDFQAQVKTKPISDSEDENRGRENDDGDNFLSRNVKRGFRLAEFALNSSIAGANLTMSIADAIAEATINHNEEEEEENNENVEYITSSTAHGHNQALAIAIRNNPHINENDLEVVSVNSSPPLTVNSSSPPMTVHSSSPSASSASSVPMPTSPQSSRASSRSRSSRGSLYNPKKGL